MLKPWHLDLSLDKQTRRNIHQQLLEQLVQLIDAGHWMADSPLPSTRDIAAQLQINRKTVARVYEELAALGKIYTQPKRGTFVASQAQHKPAQTLTQVPVSAVSALEQQVSQQIQSAILPHTRRAALHFHKLQSAAYDYRGLLALHQLIALMLAHDKRTLVSPEQLVCTNAHNTQAILLALLKQREGMVLLDTDLPAQLAFQLQEQGIATLTLPPLPDSNPEHRDVLLSEQIEKFCINYPVSSFWRVHVPTQHPPHRRESQRLGKHMAKSQQPTLHLIARKIADYGLLLLDDHRQHSLATLQQPSLTTQLPEQSVFIGNLYGMHCEMFNVYFLSLPAQLQQSLVSTLQRLQPDAHLLNMLAHVELMRCGDYKKLKNRLLNTIEAFAAENPSNAQPQKLVTG